MSKSIEEVAAQFEARQAETPAVEVAETTEETEAVVADTGVTDADATDETVVEQEVEVQSPVEKIKKDEPKDSSASRFAALARREKEARRKAEEVARREEEYTSRLKEIEEKESKLKALKERPLATLKELGLTYADITQDALQQYEPPKPDPVDEKLSPLDQRLKELEAKEAKINEKLAQIEADRLASINRQIDWDIKQTAKQGGYELVQTVGEDAFNLVKDCISEYWQKHKKVLDYSQALDMVESYYEEYALKLANASKVRQRIAPPQSEPAKQSPATATTAKEVTAPTTLTRSHSQSAPQAKPDLHKMSKHEAINYLAKKIQFIDD